jgi:hypothetical protein
MRVNFSQLYDMDSEKYCDTIENWHKLCSFIEDIVLLDPDNKRIKVNVMKNG